MNSTKLIPLALLFTISGCNTSIEQNILEELSDSEIGDGRNQCLTIKLHCHPSSAYSEWTNADGEKACSCANRN